MASVIVKNPKILGGTPVFRGTRVPLQLLFDSLERGHTLEEFLAGYSACGSVHVIGWRRYPVWQWTQRSRSLPKSVPPQRPFPPRNLSPRGWVPALATKRAPASTTATDLRRATATCGAFSTRRPTPQSRLKEASSRSSITARYHVSDTNKPSEPLLIDSVE